MSSKRFIQIFALIFCALLIKAGAIVYAIDPFGFYHKPWYGLQVVNLNQAYQNPGYAKNYDYATALIGTSMTEGMRASEVDAIFNTKTIKICQSGAHSMDIAEMLNLICKEGKAEQIILGLDANIFRKPYDTYRSEMPLYLYNDNILDDVNYLYNKDVIFGDIPEMIKSNIEGTVRTLDDFYIRDAKNYSKKKALQNYDRGVVDENSIAWNRAANNIENITPIIAANSDVTFYIYMPPYSMLFWDRYMLNDMVDEELEMQKQIIEAFVQYPNVKFYYVMNNYEIITNLDNYRDAGHYSPEVCSDILEMIYKQEYLVTENNYMDVISEMESFVQNYEYNKIFETAN